jgi:hypothetical protein
MDKILSPLPHAGEGEGEGSKLVAVALTRRCGGLSQRERPR